MAGFGKQHEAGFLLVAPMPTDKRVGLMPPDDWLQMLNAHDLTDLAGINDLLQFATIVRVAEHMADGEYLPVTVCGVNDLLAIAKMRRERFFEQHVVSLIQQGDSGIPVHAILGRNDCDIGHTAVLRKRLSVLKNILRLQ